MKNQTLKILALLLCFYAFPALAQMQQGLPNSAIKFGASPDEKSAFHMYIEAAPGIGQNSGTLYPMNSGFAYQFTAGFEFKKALGFALTYQHNSFTYSGSTVTSTIHQLMLEANVFSLLVLNGGFQLADVLKLEPGYRSADFGFGIHIGLDVNLNPHLTAGIVGYATQVLENEDHHTILNLMVPLKYWF